MNRRFILQVCLISGLSAGLWHWAHPAVTESAPVTHTSANPVRPSSTVKPSFFTSALQSFGQQVSQILPSSVAEAVTAALDPAAPSIPDAPPAAEGAVQEALQEMSLENLAMIPTPVQSPHAYLPNHQNNPATQSDAKAADAAAVPLVGAAPSAKANSLSSGSTGGSSGSNSNGGLKNEDYAALLSSFHGSFEDQMSELSGTICAIDTNVCGQAAKNPIHSLRWSQDEGLNRIVTFAIKSVGPVLQFDLAFKIQKSLTSEETVTLNLSPLTIDAQNEIVNGKSLRVIDFRFADFQARGETMYNVHAKMVFESTESGLVPTSDFRFLFSRSKASVALTRWEPNAVVVTNDPNQQPANNPLDPTLGWNSGSLNQVPTWTEEDDIGRKPSSQSGSYFLADELPFSIKIEKS